jgi:hypothetical protein
MIAALGVFVAIAVLMTSSVLGPAQAAVPLKGSCGSSLSIVHLGAAGEFRILAATTVTDTGVTMIHGNVGVSPGTSITGFSAGSVMGTINSNTSLAVKAHANLGTAYTDAVSRTKCATIISGNIGGQSFGPGLYIANSSLAISAGNLTLNAHGNNNAVFIFRMASTLTVTTGLHVILRGDANASRIYWVVGSSATLGDNTIVSGSILAHVSITLDSGAKLHGRALADIGAVTLIGNTIYHGVR